MAELIAERVPDAGITALKRAPGFGGGGPADASAESQLPCVFGRYLLMKRLSRGGMGEIFLARHGLSGFEKLVVIKKVLPNLAADEEFIRRFIDEAQVAVKLQHGNIAGVFEVGRAGSEYFLAMEYINGRDLRRVLAGLRDHGRCMPVDTALFIAREVASGLSYAHRRTDSHGRSIGLVHCDVSPPNVMMSFEGEVKIIDFGIARSALRTRIEDHSTGFGKFGYMAPEQLIKGRRIDHRTDIYAAGVVLFEMLTGRRLYDPASTPDYRMLALQAERNRHPLPSDCDTALAPYDALVRRALRADPAERYQSAAEFRDAIQQALVRINPTMSADRLAAFLRDVYSSDIVEQREFRHRLENTDLEPWAKQLTRQASGTVSFALASLRASAAETVALSPVVAHRRRRRIAAAITVAAVAIAIALWVSGLGRRSGVRTAVAAAANGANRQGAGDRDGGLRSAPSSAGPKGRGLSGARAEGRRQRAGPAPVSGKAAAPALAAGRRASAVAASGGGAEPAAAHRRHRRRHRHAAARRHRRARARGGRPTAAAVHAEFRALSRTYRRFKLSYGARLEKQWADLVTYAQFASTGDKLATLDRKIAAFRAAMRRVRAGR